MLHRIVSMAIFALASSPMAASTGQSATTESPSYTAGIKEIRTVVRFADLDLTTAGGTKALKHRVRTAAAASCGKLYRGDDLAILFKMACTRYAILAARPQLKQVIEFARLQRPRKNELAFSFRH